MPAHLVDFAASEKFSLLALEPPDHTRLRKLVNRAFLNRQVNLMSSGIRELSDRCLDEVQQQGHFDVLKHYATPIPVTVITRLLGVSEDAGEQLIAWSHAMVRVYTLTQTLEEEHLANQAAAEFQDFLKNCLAQKRHEPGDDLLSHLIKQQQDEEPISDDEIICVAILLLNAGHEATVHQLGNAVLTILNHYPIERRDQLLSLLNDDTCADALVTECLRYAAPLHLFMRYAQTTIKLSENVCLEPGEQVGLLLAAANRCPRRFGIRHNLIKCDPMHRHPAPRGRLLFDQPSQAAQLRHLAFHGPGIHRPKLCDLRLAHRQFITLPIVPRRDQRHQPHNQPLSMLVLLQSMRQQC